MRENDNWVAKSPVEHVRETINNEQSSPDEKTIQLEDVKEISYNSSYKQIQ